jgi:hypothetical protein
MGGQKTKKQTVRNIDRLMHNLGRVALKHDEVISTLITICLKNEAINEVLVEELERQSLTDALGRSLLRIKIEQRIKEAIEKAKAAQEGKSAAKLEIKEEVENGSECKTNA